MTSDMKIKELDIATVVHVYKSGVYELEFIDNKGKTNYLGTFRCDELAKEIPCCGHNCCCNKENS